MSDGDNGGVSTPERGGSLSPRRLAAGWALVVVGLPVLTVVLLSLNRGPTLSFEAMPYLVFAIACALVGGRWPAIAAAVLGALVLNYWFAEPLHTLDIANARDIATLLLFVVTAVAVGAVVDSAARRRYRAVLAENEASTLAMLNRRVLGGDYDVLELLDLVRDTFGGSRAEIVDAGASIGPDDTAVPASGNARLVLRGRLLGRGRSPGAERIRLPPRRAP